MCSTTAGAAACSGTAAARACKRLPCHGDMAFSEHTAMQLNAEGSLISNLPRKGFSDKQSERPFLGRPPSHI